MWIVAQVFFETDAVYVTQRTVSTRWKEFKVVTPTPPHHNCFTALFQDHPGEPVPEENFWTMNIGAVWPLGAGWPLKTCILGGFGAQKTISSYSFDRIVLIFGYIVERTNTKILSSHLLQFPSWTQFMTSSMT